jgi:phosphoglycerol transferase MdoB-like AlkP superfamily enzyme
VAAGAKGVKPRHVFLVVMESYDAWSMQPEFESLHLTDEMQALGRAGVWVKAFVSAGSGTMPSLSTLITGLPEIGLHVNYRPLVRQGVPTAIAPIFKRLGYRTRFFYGGYPSWQRLGDFCREQGFDEVHGGGEMARELTGNEWGVNDRDLFNFILKSTGDEPTFDMVMSTSDHPPFSVDLKKEGCPLTAMPAELAHYGASANDVRIMGHLWYADRCLGEFVRAAETNFSSCLFALTGDHYSRRCLNPHPDIFERRAVPLVLYGPGVIPDGLPAGAMAGAHLDILPTLIELCAPPGFEYHAFGRNLLDFSQAQTGFGAGAIVTPKMIEETTPPEGPESLSGQAEPAQGLTDELRERDRELRALSWWRVIRGSKF